MANNNGAPLSISLFGVTLPLPRWALGWLGLLAIAGVAGLIVRNVWPSAPELISLKQANVQMSLAVQEYGRHMWDVPTTTYADLDGVFTIKTFADHCVVIMRRVGSDRVLTRLIPDLTLEPAKQTGHLTPDKSQTERWRLLEGFAPTVEAQGRCVNPHPGPFATWYGNRDGCWIQVWRQWSDGCTHYQMLNTCNGFWDSNSDGSARVLWTACRH